MAAAQLPRCWLGEEARQRRRVGPENGSEPPDAFQAPGSCDLRHITGRKIPRRLPCPPQGGRLPRQHWCLAAEIQALPVACTADALARLGVIAGLWGPDSMIREPGAPRHSSRRRGTAGGWCWRGNAGHGWLVRPSSARQTKQGVRDHRRKARLPRCGQAQRDCRIEAFS